MRWRGRDGRFLIEGEPVRNVVTNQVRLFHSAENGFALTGSAVDGEEGLRHMLGRPVHLVISDYNMPKLDGLGLLRAIRSHPPIQKVAFIMLTGRADKELVQRAVQFGVNNYLVKPFTVQTLKEKIEAIFGVLA